MASKIIFHLTAAQGALLLQMRDGKPTKHNYGQAIRIVEALERDRLVTRKGTAYSATYTITALGRCAMQIAAFKLNGTARGRPRAAHK